MDRQFHPVANLFPLMSADEYEALRQDIGANGQREAIWLHHDGSIIDGRNRYRACRELGIAPLYRTWDGSGSLVQFVVSLNLHRRHLTESQRAMVAAKLATLTKGDNRFTVDRPIGLSTADAADLLGVGLTSVKRARAVLGQAADELVAEVERGAVAVSAAAEVATLPVEWQRSIVQNGEVAEAARDMRQGKSPHVAYNSGNNEWYTPAEYIEAARALMGGIDLDPASSPVANEVVQATRYYTQADDGLARPWAGCVWMNPPYASDLIGKFCERLVDAYVAGRVPEAVALVNNATETSWFALLASVSAAVVFPRGRVRFWQPDGERGAPLQGQAILYFGPNPSGFLAAFGAFGWGAALWQ